MRILGLSLLFSIVISLAFCGLLGSYGFRVHQPHQLWIYDNDLGEFRTWTRATAVAQQFYNYKECKEFAINMKFNVPVKCLPLVEEPEEYN